MLGTDDRDGLSRWARIERELREDIELGGLVPGSRLPSEHLLAERFGVNRHTVRRALSALQERGLIRVEQGKGTFVGRNPSTSPSTSAPGSPPRRTATAAPVANAWCEPMNCRRGPKRPVACNCEPALR